MTSDSKKKENQAHYLLRAFYRLCVLFLHLFHLNDQQLKGRKIIQINIEIFAYC